ncbi:UNVERIFIED_CONTAM: hypothetical protein GTU68_061277 [Idotea baltica]|nr:hypothetical protein [Idotea baltica]
MSMDLKPEDLVRLQSFIKTCEKCPHIIWMPELKFFRDYVESMGGTLPKPPSSSEEETASSASGPSSKVDPPMAEAVPEEEIVESDVELDTEGVIDPETIDPPELGDSSKVVSEEDEVAAGEKRSEAMSAVADGDFEKAINLFTEAIKINPKFGDDVRETSQHPPQRRTGSRPALRDCDEAIKLNPDSALAHKSEAGRTDFSGTGWKPPKTCDSPVD